MEGNAIKKFWNTVESSGNSPPELILYGDISSTSWWGDEVTSQQFNKDLDTLGDVPEIVVRINSWGGEVYEAVAIYTRLKSHKAKITVIIDGVAASAATIIAMAGDVIKIPSAGMFMIHDPMCVCYGNQAEHEHAACMLESVKNSIIAAYALKTGKSDEEISALMSAETWYTGRAAVGAGFCDEVLFGEEIKAIAADASKYKDCYKFKNFPQAFLDKITLPAEGISPPEDIHTGGTNQNQKGVESMENKVINRGLTTVRSQTTKQITTVYDIKSTDVRAESNINLRRSTPDSLVGEISFSGHKIPLYKFGVTPKSPGKGKTVSARQLKGGGMTPFSCVCTSTGMTTSRRMASRHGRKASLSEKRTHLPKHCRSGSFPQAV